MEETPVTNLVEGLGMKMVQTLRKLFSGGVANLILRVKTNLIFSFKIDAYNLFFELISYLLYFLI